VHVRAVLLAISRLWNVRVYGLYSSRDIGYSSEGTEYTGVLKGNGFLAAASADLMAVSIFKPVTYFQRSGIIFINFYLAFPIKLSV
jgi:hypothetical protein